MDTSDIRAQLKAFEPSLELLYDLAPFLPAALRKDGRRAADAFPDDPLRDQLLEELPQTLKRVLAPFQQAHKGGTHHPRRIYVLTPALLDALSAMSEEARDHVLAPVLASILAFARRGQADEDGPVAADTPVPADEASVAAGESADGAGVDWTAASPADEEPEAIADFALEEPLAAPPEADLKGAILAPPPPPENGQPVAADAGAGRHRPRKRREVNTGFCRPIDRLNPLPPANPLDASAQYLFWLEVGEPVEGSIETMAVELVPREQLAAGTRFQVALFGYDGELRLDPDARTGELEYDRYGDFIVFRQPGTSSEVSAANGERNQERRLFFPVETASRRGPQRLRCNIYLRNVLVQSRVVTAWVGGMPARGNALKAKADFSLASLSAHSLASIREHVMSVQLNDNGDRTHTFRFFSSADQQETVRDATLPAAELGDLIEQTRGSLREASWGTTSDWHAGAVFKYRGAEPATFEDDLVKLMQKGQQLYATIANTIAGGPIARSALRKTMLPSGRLQVVLTGPSSELIPTSLVYDYVNADKNLGPVTLCPAFVEARKAVAPLEEAACFQGACPSRDTPQVMCPSGLWGYRHAVGIPITQPDWWPEPPVESSYVQSPVLAFCYYPNFDLVGKHIEAITGANPAWLIATPEARSYEETLEVLKLATRPHVVYFYCHGGISDDNVPYLQIDPSIKHLLTLTSLDFDDPDPFRLPRSIVVINGCETTALEPDRAMSLVSALMQNVGAMGVIGTEITVNEELATAFGSLLLGYLRQPMEVGQAVRRARLALLKQGNPLGLVYLPLIPSDARLVERPN